MFKFDSLCLLQQHIPASGVDALLAELEQLQATGVPVLDSNAAGTNDMHSSSGGSSRMANSQGASGVAAVQAKDIQVPETKSNTPETLWKARCRSNDTPWKGHSDCMQLAYLTRFFTVQAVGQIAVQLLQLRRLFLSSANHASWQAKVSPCWQSTKPTRASLLPKCSSFAASIIY